VFLAHGTRRARVSILNGCVQTVLDPRINEATIRLLQRHGVEVVVARGAGCCGAPSEHMGLEGYALPLAKDITEFLTERDLLPRGEARNLRVAYHSACSMQHGQPIVHQPLELLRRVGFSVLEVPDGFMCCGSAGVYNLLQPEIAEELKKRKVASLDLRRHWGVDRPISR